MRVYDLQKKVCAIQEDYKDIITLCREKTRRVKTQQELNLDTVVKGNEKSFYKYINNKRKTKDNLHLLLEVGEK